MSNRLINNKIVDIKTNMSNYGGVPIDAPLNGMRLTHGGWNGSVEYYYTVEFERKIYISNITWGIDENAPYTMEIYISEDNITYTKIKKYPIRAKYVKFTPFTTAWVYVYDLKLYDGCSLLLKDSSRMFYSIDETQYSSTDKKYVPLVNNSIQELFEKSHFDFSDLTESVTINEETFRPIDKFKDFVISKKQ